MKKFFIVLGSIFLVLLVLGGIGLGVLIIRGTALDKESRAYADAAIPPIVTTWSQKELLDRASPELKKVVTIDQLDRLFGWFSRLGQLQKCEPAEGHATVSFTPKTGKVIQGKYVAKAQFENGEATVTLGVIKHGGQWQILSFHIDSPSFIPP